MIRPVILMLLLAPFCASVSADRIWIEEDCFKGFHLVVAASAPEPENLAARRFIEHWQRSTGFEPSLSNDPSDGAVNVWIGSAAELEFAAEFEARRPSADGCFILTLPRGRAKNVARRDLLLAGGGPRGTLYAEWQFFERFLGARAFAPGLLHFPKSLDGVPAIDWRYEPAFNYRDTNYRAFLETPWLMSLNHLNGQWSNAPERLGGHIGFVHGPAGHGHTFHQFVSPDEYFDSHPEYFAEIDGERIKYAQLCLTNPDVLAITIDRARRYLREAAPHERILSVSQMDYFWFDSWCTCAACRAVDELEGSHSGTIIRFVNAVAAAIEDEFPDALVDTFAYLYSRKPPKVTRPRDNVLIRLCAIEADDGRPLADWRSPDNRAFVRDLKEWRRIAKHLWVWDYTQNWRSFQAPHPNVRVLQPNLALFARVGVDGVFEQASPHSPHSDFELLKAYLIGRGLRDPRFDWKAEYRAFLDAYYGEAAPFINEYQQLLRDRLAVSHRPLYFVNDLEWMDADTVERAQEIFARAFTATDDPVIAERLRSAHLGVQYAALVCPPRVAQTPDAYVFTRPPGPTFDEYWAELTALGVTHLNDHSIDQLRKQLKGETPPRYKSAPIEKLINDAFEVWIVPERGGAIVRWRERASGRDWLAGYDDIRSTSGRLEVRATADPDRWAEPERLDQAYTVTLRESDRLVLETQLENRLVLRKHIQLTEDALTTRLDVRNTGDTPLTPKVSLIGDFSIPTVGRPTLWTIDREGEAYARKPFVRGPGPVGGPSGPLRAVALRFPTTGRTLAAEVIGGDSMDSVEFEHAARSSRAQFRVTPNSSDLAPGGTRGLSVCYRITVRRPAIFPPATP